MQFRANEYHQALIGAMKQPNDAIDLTNDNDSSSTTTQKAAHDMKDGYRYNQIYNYRRERPMYLDQMKRNDGGTFTALHCI